MIKQMSFSKILKPIPLKKQYKSQIQYQHYQNKLNQIIFQSQTSAFQISKTFCQQLLQNNQFHQQIQLFKQSKSISCNCKKTKCLKYYCECFSSKQSCGINCGCVSCMNFNLNKQVKLNQLSNLQEFERFPLKNKQSVRQLKKNKSGIKGCNCKKSNCLKKYCQCFNSNNQCSQYCKCQDCRNSDRINDSNSSKQQVILGMKAEKKIKLEQGNENTLLNKFEQVLNLVPKQEEENLLKFLFLILE